MSIFDLDAVRYRLVVTSFCCNFDLVTAIDQFLDVTHEADISAESGLDGNFISFKSPRKEPRKILSFTR